MIRHFSKSIRGGDRNDMAVLNSRGGGRANRYACFQNRYASVAQRYAYLCHRYVGRAVSLRFLSDADDRYSGVIDDAAKVTREPLDVAQAELAFKNLGWNGRESGAFTCATITSIFINYTLHLKYISLVFESYLGYQKNGLC